MTRLHYRRSYGIFIAPVSSNSVIPLERGNRTPLWRQIYARLRARILNGAYGAGVPLPSSRALAEELSVSRTIVVLAYEQLHAEGFVTGRGGSGTFVSEQLQHQRPQCEQPPVRMPLSRFGQAAETARSRVALVRPRALRFRYDFTHRRNITTFPFEAWRRVLIRKARETPYRQLDYGSAAGSDALREAVAAHLRRARGMNCDATQIVIVNGSQQALDLATRVLLETGDRAVIENPHYQGTREILQAAGAEIVPVSVDEQGLSTAALPKRARMIVVTPSHQFPTGAVLPLDRRLALLDWAKRANAAIIEDDYDGEYRYEGQSVEPLQSLDAEGRVVYVGTFSRTMFPSIRLGYLVAPRALAPVFAAAKWLCDRHTRTLDQETLAAFIESGAYERHIRKTRKALAERRDELIEAIGTYFGESVRMTGQNAGSHVVIWPVRNVSEAAVLRKAESAGIGIHPIGGYFLGSPRRPGFLLGYAGLTRREIREGIRGLSQSGCFE
jgi:GntR family transcriptional regulator/MocR family aminotransferase